MRCLECGAEGAEAVRVCARCGAPIAYPRSVAAVAEDSAADAGTGGGSRQSAAMAGATGVTLPILVAPAELGTEVPVWTGPRRVLRGYSWMAWGLGFCGWVLVAVGGYFQNVGSPLDRWYFLAGIVPGVLAIILFGQHIRWSSFLRRPGQPASATVTARQRGGRSLMLDAPCDGYPSGLKVRLAWWAGPALLLPGEDVTFYGRRGGTGKLLVSNPGSDRALVGTGRRRELPLPGLEGPAESLASAGPSAGRAALSAVGAADHFRPGLGRSRGGDAHRDGATTDRPSDRGGAPDRRLPDRLELGP
jgi:hypothetical protein